MDPLSLTTTAYQPLELQIFPGPRGATDFSNKFAPASPDLPPVCQDPKTFVKDNGTFQRGGRIHKNPSFINGIYKSNPSTIHLTKELWQGHGNSIPESHLLTAVIRTNKNLAPCLTARRGMSSRLPQTSRVQWQGCCQVSSAEFAVKLLMNASTFRSNMSSSLRKDMSTIIKNSTQSSQQIANPSSNKRSIASSAMNK